ncbi:hypothetical protein CEUSTIGMA_g14076.t1, partial [Chlamydomonas eustigma]
MYSGTYIIQASGAVGGHVNGNSGGAGAVVELETFFSSGEVLTLCVGQAGSGDSNDNSGGGGGASWVAINNSNIILVAGGGGGSSTFASGDISTGFGGTGGGGGELGGGGGYLGSGSGTNGQGGLSFLSGLTGGVGIGGGAG